MLARLCKRILPLQILLIVLIQIVGIALPKAAYAASYNNSTIADLGLKHVGENYGECWTFVRDMIYQASGHTQDISAAAGGGDYFAHLANTGGMQITDVTKLAKGDVVQMGHFGGHTFIIVGMMSDGTFDVIDANHDWAGTVMHYRRTVTLDADNHAYRFGTVGGTTVATAPAWPGLVGYTYLGSDHLNNGQVMLENQYIESPNGIYALALRPDGNLVLFGFGAAIWDSSTNQTDASCLKMQGDGNLVLYNAKGIALWSTKTDGNGFSMPQVQSDGNFIMHRNSDYATTWSTNTGGHYVYDYFGSNKLANGQTLTINQYLRSSDGRYALILRENGDLVLYGPGYHTFWDSHTSGSNANRLVMQGDGNLVLYNGGVAKWSSKTDGNGASNLYLQSDGNLVLRRATDNFPAWASGTNSKI